MGSKVEYVESSQIYAANYVRNSKAIGVLWGIFTICYSIINFVAFLTPEWLGNTVESDYPARFGLWSTCNFSFHYGEIEYCQRNFNDLFTFPVSFFKIAALCGIISVLISVLTVFTFLLFFFCNSAAVYRICGWMQIFSAKCLIIAVIVYPLSWNSDLIHKTCSTAAHIFYPGDCSIRWAYFLAIIGCLDAIVLATLAFILATKHVKLQPEPACGNNGSLYKGEINCGYVGDMGSVTGSRKSLNLHPVLLIPQPVTEGDRFSEVSARTGRSKISGYKPEYTYSIQNFQL